MHEPAAALAELLARARIIARREHLPLRQARGRTLAEPVLAAIANPPFHASAMDGYALGIDEPAPAGSHFTVTHTAAAGAVAAPLEPGCAARIYTGAPLPEGANTVVIQENVVRQGGVVELLQPLSPHANVRWAGEDFAPGTELLPVGTPLGAAQLGLAAAAGADHLAVVAAPSVMLISTGDELREPGESLAPGQIINSNSIQLSALLTGLGCEVTCRHVPDQLTALCAALEEAGGQADLIITTGGASVGDRDHLKDALASCGHMQLYKVAMKPGKPLVFGEVGAARTPLLGLPGNPVSAFVTFALFGKPFLDALQGRAAGWPEPVCLPARFSLRAGGRTEFLRVRRRQAGLELLRGQGSHQLGSLAQASGLAQVAPGAQVAEGSPLPYFSFAELLSAVW